MLEEEDRAGGRGDSLLLVSHAALIQEAVEHLDGPTGVTDVILVVLAGSCALAFQGPREAHQLIVLLWNLGVMAFEEAQDHVVLTAPEAGKEAVICVSVESGGHTSSSMW